MVWGLFFRRGLGPLVKVEGKMNRLDYIDILEKNLLPFIQFKHHKQPYAFQDDNAPVHTARDVKIGLLKNRLRYFPIGLLNLQTFRLSMINVLYIQ